MAEKHLIHIENSGEDYLCAPDQNLLSLTGTIEPPLTGI